MTETNFNKINQINLFEIFAIIWSHKILIVISILFHQLRQLQNIRNERLYTAKAIFKLETPSSSQVFL